MLVKRLTRLLTEQAVDDASYLWLLRNQAVLSANYFQSELMELDERLEGYLDEIRLAGSLGWQVCEDNLMWKDAGEIFVGMVAAANQGSTEVMNKVIQVGSQSVELSRGIVSALAWENNENTQTLIKRLLKAQHPLVQRVGVGAAAVTRNDLDQQLSGFIENESVLVRARALKAVGELGRKDLLDACLQQTKDENEHCRFWAAWSSTLLGNSQSALSVLKTIAETGGNYSEQACDLAGRSMDREHAQEWLQELGQDQSNLRLAVIFAGAVGMPVLVSWLINMMTIPELARKAAESFVNITGADLIEQDLAGDEPEGFTAGPSENPDEEFVAMDADEDLPWPDVNKIAHWWAHYKDRYTGHERYLCGQLINAQSMKQILSIGKQSNRHAAALELALMEPGKPLVEVRACSI
jgi:uncharacterized protein (TIGR02270 family)